MNNIFKFSERPKFENLSLIVGWQEGSGKLSPKVIEYLNKKIKGKSFCEIEPAGFFSLAGVAIENNVAQFPESKFYYPPEAERNDLVIFKGSEPHFERYKFLNAIADLAQHHFKIKELYTISSTISLTAHTSPRRISAVFNQREFQQSLRGYGLQDMNWEGPPAISSYLLWIAKNRGIPGVSLWPEIPFYLAAGEDFQAIKMTLSFLDSKFNLDMDFAELDEEIKNQNTKIERLREEDSEIDKYIEMLESELSLSEDEQVELTMKVTELLEEKN
jgi:proteasome assembly chaperone (PAC2) family protein